MIYMLAQIIRKLRRIIQNVHTSYTYIHTKEVEKKAYFYLSTYICTEI